MRVSKRAILAACKVRSLAQSDVKSASLNQGTVPVDIFLVLSSGELVRIEISALPPHVQQEFDRGGQPERAIVQESGQSVTKLRGAKPKRKRRKK